MLLCAYGALTGIKVPAAPQHETRKKYTEIGASSL